MAARLFLIITDVAANLTWEDSILSLSSTALG